MLYCPKCKNFDLKVNRPDRDTHGCTLPNMRGGYGRPISHYKCECGNPLAGIINTSSMIEDERDIEYFKDLILQYNEGGTFFDSGLLELAEERYLEFSKRKERYIESN